MKFLPLVLATAAALTTSGLAMAQPGPSATCAAKRDAISRDIDAAKADGQTQRVRGLERALAEVRRNCSDARLAADHQQRVRSQERRVAQRERELREARRKGDADKVARREDKLREAQAELQRIKDLP